MTESRMAPESSLLTGSSLHGGRTEVWWLTVRGLLPAVLCTSWSNIPRGHGSSEPFPLAFIRHIDLDYSNIWKHWVHCKLLDCYPSKRMSRSEVYQWWDIKYAKSMSICFLP